MCRARRRSPHVFFGTLECTTLMGELSGRTGAGGVPPPTLGAPEARPPCARRLDLEPSSARGNIHNSASVRYARDGLLYLFLGVLQVNQIPCKVLLVGREVEVAVAAEVEEDDLLLA